MKEHLPELGKLQIEVIRKIKLFLKRKKKYSKNINICIGLCFCSVACNTVDFLELCPLTTE